MLFGNIIWESGTSESSVVLSDIHIDIMDYIKPAYCNETHVGCLSTELKLSCVDLQFHSSEICGPSLNGRTE